MDDVPARSIILFLLCIFGMMVCSATETALTSVNRVRIMSRAADGDRRAMRVLYVLTNFDRALTTTLICSNIFSTGCATVSAVIAIRIGGDAAVAAATAIATIIVFFAAEMLPKSFGMNRSEYFSVLIAPVISGAMKLLRPLVAAFTAVSRFFSRLFIKDNSTSATYTEEELHDIVNTIADEGTIEPEKSQLIKSALNFSDVLVESIMTPWDKTEKIRKDASFDEVMAVYSKSKHTRFPLVDDEGRPLGLLHIRLFLNSYLQNNIKQNAAEVSSEPFYIDSKTPAEKALREMSESKTNLAFFISRPYEKSTHTETVGIVTVEDILESLVGDISDESDDGGDVL